MGRSSQSYDFVDPQRGDRIRAETTQIIHRELRRYSEGQNMIYDSRGVRSFGEAALAFRRFELTAELSGGQGATAAVNWLEWDRTSEEWVDDGTDGEVVAALGNEYGLQGEQGVAQWVNGQWEVVVNPGSGIYVGTASGAISSSPGSVSVTIEGTGRTVSCTIPTNALDGGTISSGDAVVVGNFRGTFYIISIAECTA